MGHKKNIPILFVVLAVSLPVCFSVAIKPLNDPLKNVESDSSHTNRNNPRRTRLSNQPEDYKQLGLEIHNSFRQQCQSPLVKLNDTLTAEADKWANFQLNLKQKKIAPLPTRPDYNVLFFTQNQILEGKEAIQQAVEGWHSDKKRYNWDSPKATGFSEIVWKSTTDIGVGFATREGKTVVAVTYWPPGNIYLLGPGDKGKFFKENVPKQC